MCLLRGDRRLDGTAEARFRSQVSQCEIFSAQSGVGTGFSPVLRFSHSSNDRQLSSSKCCCYQEDKRANRGTLPENSAVSEIGSTFP